MEAEGRGRRTAPYDRVAELKLAALEPEPEPDPEPEPEPDMQSRWIKPIERYVRRETSFFAPARYG